MAGRSMEVSEPAVISLSLIRSSIVPAPGLDGAPLPADKREQRKQEMEWNEVDTLSFSFQNILKIDNLSGLENLVKLQLDNNIIEKVENMSHLTNLQWLDLSFNNIAKTEGLEALTKLTDLSLFNNRIGSLDSLDSLVNLSVFSIGNNEIRNLEQMLYLRRFKNLRLLNANGNPASKDPEYRSYVIAHVRGLKYLDYRLVEKQDVVSAREHYIEDIIEIEEKESQENEAEEKAAEAEARAAELAAAHLTGVDTLVDDMFNEDTEMHKLSLFSFWQDLVDECKESAQELARDFVSTVLSKHSLKGRERSRFEKAYKASHDAVENTSIALIRNFEKAKKKLFRQLNAMEVSDAVKALQEMLDVNSQVQSDLMEIELHQCEEEEELILEFERNFGEVVQNNAELVQSHFMKLRDLEKGLHEKAQSLAVEELEKFANGQLDDVSEDVAVLLQDKESAMNSLNASHDLHLSKIDAKEDFMIGSQQRAFQAAVVKDRTEAALRNRSRISEIAVLVEKGHAEISEMVSILQDSE